MASSLELSSQTLRARGLRMFLCSAGVWGVSLSVGISFRGSSACRVQAVDIEGMTVNGSVLMV